MLNNKPQAIIFDMNGVIVDDERVHQESWRQICKRYNIFLTEDEFKQKIFGRTEKDTFEFLLQKNLTKKELENYSNERVAIAIEIYKSKISLTQGLAEFLDYLSNKKIPLAIATSARVPYTNFILDTLNIRSYFKVIVTAEDIVRGKPEPEIYLLAAQKLTIDPKKCIAIEDSLSGIRSAKSAGMQVIAITTTHQAEDLNEADDIIISFIDIKEKNIV